MNIHHTLIEVVLNILGGRGCIEQAFGNCSHNCRESDIQPIQYECYCDNGYVLHGNFDCFAASKLQFSCNNLEYQH